jgi:hypothetical protein
VNRRRDALQVAKSTPVDPATSISFRGSVEPRKAG